jgi:hypothetical protein
MQLKHSFHFLRTVSEAFSKLALVAFSSEMNIPKIQYGVVHPYLEAKITPGNQVNPKKPSSPLVGSQGRFGCKVPVHSQEQNLLVPRGKFTLHVCHDEIFIITCHLVAVYVGLQTSDGWALQIVREK